MNDIDSFSNKPDTILTRKVYSVEGNEHLFFHYGKAYFVDNLNNYHRVVMYTRPAFSPDGEQTEAKSYRYVYYRITDSNVEEIFHTESYKEMFDRMSQVVELRNWKVLKLDQHSPANPFVEREIVLAREYNPCLPF